MKTLKDLKNWAREEGIVGFSKMSKAELLDLWEESQPEGPRKKGFVKPRKRKKIRNLIDEEFEFDAPILIPERKIILKKEIPSVIEKNLENVLDWMNWLKRIDDVKVRRRVDPVIEELKRKIENLWEKELVVEEGKSALKGFAKQFVVQGDDSLSPQDFLRKVRLKVLDLLRDNPQTKGNLFSIVFW